MRAQQIYDKPFNDLTSEEQNKIRESILGNIMTTAEVATVGGFTYGAARKAIRENIANQNIDHSPNAYTSSPKTTKTIFTFNGNEIIEKKVNNDYISPWKIETEDSIFTFNADPRNRKVEKNIDFNKGVFTFSPTIEALNNYGCFRLAAIIHTLKHYEGMNIKTEIRKMDGKRWAVYSLNNTKTDINTLIQAAENNS